jgi:hypothetical protein
VLYSFILKDLIRFGAYFSTGTTIPRMMRLWQKVKTRKVRIETMRRPANMMPCELRDWS